MNHKFVITEEPQDLELNARMERFRRNGEGLTAHGTTFFEQFPGKYLAVS